MKYPAFFTGRNVLLAALLAVGCGPSGRASEAGEDAWKEITLDALEDKVRGGWAGQMIGVSYGAPTEFQYPNQIIPLEDLPEWRPEMIAEALNQDDIYVDVTLASVLDERGLDATTEDFGEYFREAEYTLWHANLASRRALKRGVPAALAGTPKYNVHANDIDFQIEADFIGLSTPGLPQASNDICLRAGALMNHGDGLYGGMFISAMYAAAFFEDDPRKIVEAGLAVLPAESPYAMVIADVLEWSLDNPDDWTEVWRQIEALWNRREPCPEGAFRDFNIDAKINGAYVALGLLYGEGDMTKTITVATRAGQDSDCNPSSAAGILGVVLGYDAIPSNYTDGFEAISEEKFSYTDDTFESLVAKTTKRAVAVVERNGGRVEGEMLIVRTQSPEPAELEIWDDYGSPVESVRYTDSRWSWDGDWGEKTVELWGYDHVGWASGTAGAEVTIAFEGTGAILTGWFLPTGGQADIYLDGEFSRTVDVYPDEPNIKLEEAVWHEFGLEDSDHELRLVVRGEPFGESEGTDIAITSLSIFR